MEPPKISYETADFSAILRKDARYDSRAYDFVLRVIEEASHACQRHVSGRELLDFFRDLALDAYGPLAYTVLQQWGVSCCEDVGEIVFNLCDAKMCSRTETDSREDFIGGFSFEDEFLGPFRSNAQ